MAKKLSNLEFVKDIDSLCEFSVYDLHICKEIDDAAATDADDDDSDFCVYYNPDWHTDYKDSSSYYGEKDYHIVYSNYSYYLSDYPDDMIDEIETNYEAIQNLKKTMVNLETSGKFKDIELMSPHARSLDGDNIVFMIGFNDV